MVRSPGVYYNEEIDKNGRPIVWILLIFLSRGAWLEYETDAKGLDYVRIDRTRKLPMPLYWSVPLGSVLTENILRTFGGSI